MDGDEGDITTKRPDGLCSRTPAALRLTINTPASIAKICPAGGAAFGPTLTTTGSPTTSCVAIGPGRRRRPVHHRRLHGDTNAAAVTGKIASSTGGPAASR